ncbi:unnamed protein product [Effrenium voratum]|nr:unnamed protein product [Effrenium voratum]
MRDVDFDEGFDFRTPTKPSPLQRLRDERRARRSPNCFTPRPAELFTEASGFADLDLEASDALSGARSGVCDDANTLEEPNEDAFVASQALVRQREYELLEAWLQKGGAPEPFAPWFREMLMDQDDAACCSAVRAVTAHYRRVAKQQIQGEAAKAAPLAWLPGLLENLTERNLPQAAELAAAVLAVPALRGATSRDHEFFQHLVGPGAARLLAACQEQRVLQAEDLHEMAKVVQKTVRLPLEETEALSPAPGPKRPCPLQLLSGCEPKTWRQRLQCLDQIRGPDADGVHGPLLWSQLVLQAEDDHPAVSAAALQCLARLAHEMPPPGDHLLQRLGVALRHRVKEPRGKAACAQLLVAMAKTKWPQPLKLLLTNGLRLPKDLARQAVADLERHRPHEGELPILEALLAKRDARPMGTPSPRKIWASPKRTPSTATPSPASFASPLAARRCEDLPSASARTLAFASPKVPTARKAFVEIENRGSWLQLPWDSQLLSFEERKVREDRGERLRIPEVNEAVLTAALERLEEEEPKAVAEDLCSLALECNLEIIFKFADRAEVPGWLGVDVQSEVIARILEVKPDRILLVTETTVEELHGDYFAPLVESVPSCGSGDNFFAGNVPVDKYVLPGGDESKSWDYLSQLIEWGFDTAATKKSLIVAFGGGALMNVCGLFASILYRGSKLVYVPTTLLAMHDVTTSLKTSI